MRTFLEEKKLHTTHTKGDVELFCIGHSPDLIQFQAFLNF